MADIQEIYQRLLLRGYQEQLFVDLESLQEPTALPPEDTNATEARRWEVALL